jgi:flagellar biosynthesis/type III secretory pathway protein FliH
MKEGIEKGIEKGMKEGIEKGIEKGKEEGIIKAKQDALVHILEVRFKKLPSDIVDKIKTMNDPKEIDKLLTKAVTVKNINAFAKLIASFSR